MKKTVILLIILIFSFSSPTLTQAAQTKIEVSNNAEGGNSHVSVNSRVESSSHTSVTTNDSKTDVVIESNGEKKEYHSTDPNINISLESSDGNAKVNINNSESKPTSPTSSPTHAPSPGPSTSPRPTYTPTPTAIPAVLGEHLEQIDPLKSDTNLILEFCKTFLWNFADFSIF